MTNYIPTEGSENTIDLSDNSFSLKIIYESGRAENTYNLSFSDILEDILKKFVNKINIEYSSIYVLYSGKQLQKNELKKNFEQIMSNIDKTEKKMTILVNNISSNQTIVNINDRIKIYLIIENEKSIILEGNKTETLEEILNKNINKIGKELNSLIFNYGLSVINLDQKFDDIANDSDKATSIIRISCKYKSKSICRNKKKCIIWLSIIIGIILAITISIILYFKFKPNSKLIKCEEGYYLPDNSKKCEKCSIEGCKICKGKYNNDECIDCGILLAIKENGKIIKCVDESSDIVPDTKSICDEGYFVPDYYTSCKKCSLEGCKKCKGTYYNNECLECNTSTAIIRNEKIIRCKSCDKGYFVPDDDTICKKCSLDGCEICKGTNNNNECLKCNTSTTIIRNEKIIRCKSCDKGYFIPDDDTICKKCSLEGCIKCQGIFNNNECLDCGDLTAIKQNGKITKCIKCNNPGYFVPDDGTSCIKCSLEGCKKCKGNINNDECLECSTSTTIIRNNNIVRCKSCNEGYFVPDDDISCKKCSLEGCIKCQGSNKNNICTDCGYLKSIYRNGTIIECRNTCETGSEEKCLTCHKSKIECTSCNIGYKLIDGKCKPDFYIKAIYDIKIEGYWELFNGNTYTISRLIIDGKNITSIEKKYQFDNVGEHIVYIKFRTVPSSSGSGFFKNNEYLKSVIFSDFDEDFSSNKIPDLSFAGLFQGCENLISVDFSNISHSYGLNINNMFQGCINLLYVNLNFKYKVLVTYAENVFQNCSSLALLDLSQLNVSKVTSFVNLFYGCRSLISLDLSMLSVEKITSFKNMFYGCISLQSINLKNLELKSVEDLSYMFYNCTSLKNLDLSYFRPAKLTNMEYMFYNCSCLTSIYLDKFYTSEVTNMRYLFHNCASLKTINLTSFYTREVNNMSNMFKLCTSLTSIEFGQNFVTDKVVNIRNFFGDCHSLTSVNLENFNTGKVSSFNYMFYNCYNLKNVDISRFKFIYNVGTYYMFSGCFSLTSIDFKNEPIKLGDYTGIFYDCLNLTYVNFSFVNNSNSYFPIFNENISYYGVIILNRGFYEHKFKNHIPSGWNHTLE